MAARCFAWLLPPLLWLPVPVAAAPLTDPSLGYSNTLLVGHTDTVWDIAFSPDGELLASASEDGTVRLWDTAAAKEVATLVRQKDEFQCVAFAPDGKAVAAGDTVGRITLWDVATRKRRAAGSQPTGATALAFSPDGKTLASAGRDGGIRLWDAARFSSRATAGGHEDKALCLACSPDGRTLASGGRDGKVKLRRRRGRPVGCCSPPSAGRPPRPPGGRAGAGL